MSETPSCSKRHDDTASKAELRKQLNHELANHVKSVMNDFLFYEAGTRVIHWYLNKKKKRIGSKTNHTSKAKCLSKIYSQPSFIILSWTTCTQPPKPLSNWAETVTQRKATKTTIVFEDFIAWKKEKPRLMRKQRITNQNDASNQFLTSILTSAVCARERWPIRPEKITSKENL